jgi:two-component system, LytTR family, response regulator
MTDETTALRVLIVDDEPPARDLIREVVEQTPGVQIVGEAGDGVQAAEAIVALKPDVVFLDVKMPEMDGFGVLAALPEGTVPLVIFVTAFDAYALRAFEVHAVDYVLKPFDRDRLTEALSHARDHARLARSADREERVMQLLADVAPHRRPLERVLVKTGARFEFVRTADVDWFEAAGNYVSLHVAKRAPLLRSTLGSVEEQLDPERFRRIHRSVIVNLDRIREIKPLPGGEHAVLLRDGTELRLSRSYRHNVLSGWEG